MKIDNYSSIQQDFLTVGFSTPIEPSLGWPPMNESIRFSRYCRYLTFDEEYNNFINDIELPILNHDNTNKIFTPTGAILYNGKHFICITCRYVDGKNKWYYCNDMRDPSAPVPNELVICMGNRSIQKVLEIIQSKYKKIHRHNPLRIHCILYRNSDLNAHNEKPAKTYWWGNLCWLHSLIQVLIGLPGLIADQAPPEEKVDENTELNNADTYNKLLSLAKLKMKKNPNWLENRGVHKALKFLELRRPLQKSMAPEELNYLGDPKKYHEAWKGTRGADVNVEEYFPGERGEKTGKSPPEFENLELLMHIINDADNPTWKEKFAFSKVLEITTSDVNKDINDTKKFVINNAMYSCLGCGSGDELIQHNLYAIPYFGLALPGSVVPIIEPIS